MAHGGDLGYRREDRLARHGVTIAEAEEALADVDAVVFDRDYASKSGRSIRTIGSSRSFGDLPAVFTVPFKCDVYGFAAYRADTKRDRTDHIEGV